MATGRPVGRPAKPVERHRAAGNPSKKTLPDAPMPGEGITAAGDIPEPSIDLGEAGRRLWDRLWLGSKTWLAPNVDETLLEKICSHEDEIADYTRTLEVEGRWYETKNGQQNPHQAFTQRKKLQEEQTAWLAAFGQSPSDRARLGLAEVRVRDELDELALRKAAREAERATRTAAS